MFLIYLFPLTFMSHQIVVVSSKLEENSMDSDRFLQRDQRKTTEAEVPYLH